MTNILQSSGGQPQKQPKYVAVFQDRAFTGLYTQRAVLHDPSDIYTARFYGGRPDALLGGRNIELTNRLTLQRRPGTTSFSTATYPTSPDRAFSFQLSDGSIQVIIDTQQVGGTPGAVYVDNQNGTKTLLFTKSLGAGQAYFLAVAGVLYVGDGIETFQYTPTNPNGKIWQWGIAAPSTQPGVIITESGASAVRWQASSTYTTMGFVTDSYGNIWQLNSVNASGTNTTQYGTSGNGAPAWNQSPGGTTSDSGVTWTNFGPIGTWAPNSSYSNSSVGGTSSSPCAIYDPTSNCVFLVFNAGLSGGTSGTHKPSFTNSPGAFFNDGTVKWGCMGLPSVWHPSHSYLKWGNSNPANDVGRCAVEPLALTNPLPSQPIYLQVVTTAGTSGAGTASPFPASPLPGVQQYDGDLIWNYLSSGTWPPNMAVSGWSTGATQFNVVVDNHSEYEVCTTTGTTAAVEPGTSYTLTGATIGAGITVYSYASTTPVPAGAGNLNLVVTGFVNSGNNGTFQIISSTATSVTVASTTGVVEGPVSATGVYNPWSLVYGGTTSDGTAVWTNVGGATGWTPNTIWYLPLVGFASPSPSQPYGGAAVIDTNNNVEYVINSGLSQTPGPPAWTVVGAQTSDNSIIWYADTTFTPNSLAWSFGFAYAYSYYSRPVTDEFSPLPFGGGAIPPGLNNPLGPPTGSETGAISTASPVNQIIGPNTGAVNTISGIGSTNPAVDTIIIWRSADSASGADNMFFLTEIPNPKPIGSVAQPWSFQDYLPSVATGSYPGLNILIPAPIDDQNDPPPSNFLPMVFNYSRIWGTVGEEVLFSGGPDVDTGNPNEAFNPSDELPFLAPVIRLVRTSQGIVVFLTDGIEFIGGGPATATFFSTTIVPGVGLLSYNACDVYAGEIYFFGSDNIFHVFTPALNLSNFGFPLGDQFANQPAFGSLDTTWNPAKVYVAVHQNGVDNCIFVADGSTGWYRLNPHQVPGAAQGPEPIWSPFATITGGCQMVQSIEVSPGIKKLLIGGTGLNQKIQERSLTVFTDSGTAYDAFFTMGSINLTHPGELALLKFFEFDFSGIGTEPTVSYLLNEISGTFTPFVNGKNGVPQPDPPAIYGDTTESASYSPNRYYLLSNASLGRCRHLQLKVDYGTNALGTELYTLTIYGRWIVET